MIKAVIFDMDGVIIDTELLQSESWETVLKEHCKTPIKDESNIIHTIGIKAAENWKRLRKEYSIDSDFEVSFQRRKEVYLDLLNKHKNPMPGLLTLLQLLKKEKLTLALASNALEIAIKTILKNLQVKDYFTVVVSGEKLEHGKPFPDIFLITAEKLQVQPNDCVVIEDYAVGVEAAKNAGMKVIAIPTEYTKHQDFSKADKIVNYLNDISINGLHNL